MRGSAVRGIACAALVGAALAAPSLGRADDSHGRFAVILFLTIGVESGHALDVAAGLSNAIAEHTGLPAMGSSEVALRLKAASLPDRCMESADCIRSSCTTVGASRLLFLSVSRAGARLQIEAALADCAYGRIDGRVVKALPAEPTLWAPRLAEAAAVLFTGSGEGWLNVVGREGTRVWVDGRPAGDLPLAAPIRCAAGSHDIEVRRGRGDRAAGRTRVFGGLTSTVDAQLLSSAGPGASAIRGTPLYKRWWFWTAIGAVVVSATAVGIGVWATGCHAELGCL